MSATKGAALYAFLSGFGIPAYTTTSVPSDATFPYLTYDFETGAFDEGQCNVTVNLWYRGDSEAPINAKAQEMSEAIGRGGILKPCAGGAVWLTRGEPWCQTVNVIETDEKIKRRYINIDAEWLTTD
jgi:hypothetical protein